MIRMGRVFVKFGLGSSRLPPAGTAGAIVQSRQMICLDCR